MNTKIETDLKDILVDFKQPTWVTLSLPILHSLID